MNIEDTESESKSLEPLRAAVAVAIAGILITISVSWAASALNRDNDHRLLVEQTRQAATVISSGILGIANPLTTGLKIEAATGGTQGQFDQFMSTYVGPGRLFSSASLWEFNASSLKSVASLGGAPALLRTSGTARSLANAAAHSTSFVVTHIRSGTRQSIGYAVAEGSSPTFVIYAERAIPANRRVAVEANSAFSDLDYATYLGATTSTADLTTTDLSPRKLPLRGNIARVSIPFGNSSITLVATPRGQLGGTVGAQLPWVFLIGGTLLTALIAAAADQLVRRRRVAERDAQTIAELYDRLNGLYGEQRSIAETLQRALLPQQNPAIANLEIASRYVAGAIGVDVGGDWYSVIALDETMFAFVVGDVSGRGIGAATIMARLRFTIRAYLFEGHPPDKVLEMTSRQLDISTDGYLATVLVGLGDRSTGELMLASAGHLPPLSVAMSNPTYIDVRVGPPLGVGQSEYPLTAVDMPSGSTFLAFTDGLVERRREDIDQGFERLAAAASLPGSDLEPWLDRVVAAMDHDDAEDDIAVLALRWTSALDRSAVPSRPMD